VKKKDPAEERKALVRNKRARHEYHFEELLECGVSLVGSGFQLSAGNYDALILTRLIIGGLLGAFAGTYLASVAPQRVFRVALSLWLISLGIQLCWSGVSRW